MEEEKNLLKSDFGVKKKFLLGRTAQLDVIIRLANTRDLQPIVMNLNR